MRIIENYADLLRKIKIIETQIEMLEIDVDYWLGPKDNLPFTGKGSKEYGIDIAALNVDKFHKRLNELHKMLEYYQEIQQELIVNINALEGLHYKIAKMRFLEDKTYQEISEELGYTYGYIRRVVSKGNKEVTAIIKKP